MILGIFPLASRVLTVAVKGSKGDWAAYIDAVPGIRHESEAQAVADNGEKLPEEVAAILFPRIAQEYVWRK